MKYIRKFQSGTGGSDPRNKWNAVYKCGACGHEEWVRIADLATFAGRDRVCPACGAMDALDLRKNLELKRAALEEQRASLDREIEKLVAEIESLPVEEKA